MSTPSRFDMATLADPAAWRDGITDLVTRTREALFSVDAAVQLGVIAAVVLIALALSTVMMRALGRGLDRVGAREHLPATSERLVAAVRPALALIGLLTAQAFLPSTDVGVTLVRIAASLSGAWLIIATLTRLIGDPFWRRAVAAAAWIGAVLNAFGLLGAAADALDAVGFQVEDGETASRISLLIILRAAVVVVAVFAIAGWVSTVLRRRIEALPKIEPSLRLLFAKSVQIALLAAAGLLALSTVGIDLSALAIFGGAIGLGIGFGLQQIFANLVSGVILLLDRSIKPGDVIEVDDTYGWVNSLGLRYASVVTRDGHEHLIPNERLMTDKVVNWSFSSKTVRIKRAIGISYSADVHRAIALVVEAAQGAPRTLAEPAPKCLLVGFGDNSVDLEVRFWINDPENGVTIAANDVLLRVWDAFQEHGIEIPFPQRDVHLKTGGPIAVTVDRETS